MKTFESINIVKDNKEQLRNCFLFFFFIAICGYISLIVSFCPYSDDAHRYVTNLSVGELGSLRSNTFLLELFAYLSTVITDTAPFSHIISCLFLAYSATICLKIFDVDLNNKWEVLCFAPVIINPYMLEVMMYRFDNSFITFAFMLSITSVYLSSSNNKRWLFAQVALLLLCLFTYQPALFVYFIAFTYFFINELSLGQKFVTIISKMRYWFLTLAITAICYVPFALSLRYSKVEGKSLFVIPTNIKNIRIITDNIIQYFSKLYVDWSENTAGQIFFFMFIIFALNMIFRTAVKTRSVSSILLVAIYTFIFTLCPIGTCLLLRTLVYEGNEAIVRIMYSVGLLISLVLFSNHSLFKKNKGSDIFHNFLISIFVIWNMVFLNSAANIIQYFRELQQHVFYDISKDIFDITNKDQNIKKICITGTVETQAMSNFFKLYPIMNRIIPEQWNIPDYCRIALINPQFSKQILTNAPICEEYIESEYSNKKLIKSHMMYNIFSLDHVLLLIELKKNIKIKRAADTIATIRK